MKAVVRYRDAEDKVTERTIEGTDVETLNGVMVVRSAGVLQLAIPQHAFIDMVPVE